MVKVERSDAGTLPHITPGAMELTPQAAAKLLQELQGARAMLRAVVVAEAAVKDQAIDWGPKNGGPDRWHPVMSEVSWRLGVVRDIAMDTAGFNNLDWPTFVVLAEALDAAVWHGAGGGAEALDSGELVSAIRVLISLLDDALATCATEGVPARSAMH